MDVVVDGKTYAVNIPQTGLRNMGQNSQGTDFAAMLEEQNQIKNQIMDEGFGKYVSDIQQQKLEEKIRDKVLAAMGLTEEQFNALPAEQRSAIEQAIQETIQKEMMARAEENAKGKANQAVSVPLIAMK
ncbi:hypothetical protein [Terasakiella sp.]|uniref:hypothetical protein n=1 Tax=Terasakiella sp. TaxID=2034861 RepID=UPI003AA9542B